MQIPPSGGGSRTVSPRGRIVCGPLQHIAAVVKLTIWTGRNLREKNSEVEKLKKQLQKLKGGESRDSASSSSSVHSDIIGSDTGKGAESTKSASPEAPEWPAYNFPAGAKEQESSSDVDLMFFQFASDIDESGSNASGVQLGMDGMDLEGPASSGRSMHNGGVADALCLNFTTACPREPISGTSTYSCHTRASSFGTSEPDLYTPYLGTTFNPDVQGYINFSPPVPVSEDLPLAYAGATGPSFQQLPRMGSPIGDPASSLDLFGTDTQDGDADPHWSPDTNASLLHFAVAGGNVETLRLLLKHKPHLAGVHDADGYTPIQRAIMVGRTDMVALFLEHADCF